MAALLGGSQGEFNVNFVGRDISACYANVG
jgi:hypothetical protein